MTPAPGSASAGLVAMLLAVLVFSSSSTIVKWAETSGAVVAFWRMVIAVTLWWIVIAVRRVATGRPAPSLATWRRVLPAGLLFGFNITIFFTAINHTSIAHAEFITALSPLALVPLGALLFHERPDSGALRWAGLTLIGLAMVLFLGGSQGGATLGGDALVVVAVGTWVSYLLTSRQAREHGRRRRLHDDDDADRDDHGDPDGADPRRRRAVAADREGLDRRCACSPCSRACSVTG